MPHDEDHRSAETGRYVTEADAAAHPDTTVAETRHHPAPTPENLTPADSETWSKDEGDRTVTVVVEYDANGVTTIHRDPLHHLLTTDGWTQETP